MQNASRKNWYEVNIIPFSFLFYKAEKAENSNNKNRVQFQKLRQNEIPKLSEK